VRTILLALAVMLAAGCYHPATERCPDCAIMQGRHPALRRWREGTRTVYVIVPGILGYGWEWDDAVRALREARGVDFVVFEWNPWASLRTTARELGDAIIAALFTDGRVERVVVVGHSVGGMLAAQALRHVVVPEGRQLDVVTVGAPFAGMKGSETAEPDVLGAPTFLSIMSIFRDYPKPPPRTRVVTYVTSYPADPVMKPRWGQDPARPDVGPPGALRVAVDAREDHNKIVSKLVRGLLEHPFPPALLPVASASTQPPASP